MDEYSSVPNHLAPNAAAKKPREFWISEKTPGGYFYAFEEAHIADNFKGVHVIEASYAKELEAEIERLKDLAAGNMCGYCWREMEEKSEPGLKEENDRLRKQNEKHLELFSDLNAVLKTAMHNGHHDLIQRVADVCKGDE